MCGAFVEAPGPTQGAASFVGGCQGRGGGGKGCLLWPQEEVQVYLPQPKGSSPNSISSVWWVCEGGSGGRGAVVAESARAAGRGWLGSSWLPTAPPLPRFRL